MGKARRKRMELFSERLTTIEVQLAAVQQDGYTIRFIKNPSENIKLIAELCK